MIVRFTPPARVQLISVVEYIQADRPSAASAFRERAGQALLQLVSFPESGRVIPEFSALRFRELLVDSYRFFYVVRDDVIWIVGVWHDAQIPNEPTGPGGA